MGDAFNTVVLESQGKLTVKDLERVETKAP